MNKGILIFGFILLLIIAGAIFLYFFYEKPVQEEAPPMHNINIRFLDAESGKQVRTDYVVTTTDMNVFYKQGTSTDDGFSLAQVPVNVTFRVFNLNKEDQKFYTSFEVNNEHNGVPSDYRLDIPITDGGNLSVETLTDWPGNNSVGLKVTSKGTFKNLGFCVRWSRNILGVYADGYTEEPLPYRYKTGVTVYDRCWNAKKDLKDDSLVIVFRYAKWGEIASDDFIRFVFMDGDISYKNPAVILREDTNHNDTGVPDIVYLVQK